MLHLIWYIIVGLIAGWAAKSLMHMHMSLLWTIVLGVVGSIVGGLVTHIFSRPKPGAQFHPAGIIVSILGHCWCCGSGTSTGSTFPLDNNSRACAQFPS
jgi:uncharacterized membrane protein YeaQ/YmgE (transglycosylase-associated protein family)